MNYDSFERVLNDHIFSGEKSSLLRKVADRPERYLGVFRPTKPRAKLIQNILQSNEIRFGDAMEDIISLYLEELGFSILPVQFKNQEGEELSVDHYFKKDERYFFIEQKVRDDHDSTKKRGQIENFEKKLEILHGNHNGDLVGFIYFIDPDLTKNKTFYSDELASLRISYGIELFLQYGSELFEYFQAKPLWEELLGFLDLWKESLPEFPVVNFDLDPGDTIEEIKSLERRFRNKLLDNERLWSEGIIQVLFPEGTTLYRLLDQIRMKDDGESKKQKEKLGKLLSKYYPME